MDLALIMALQWPDVAWRCATTYADLVRTCPAPESLPSEAELEAAWTAYLAAPKPQETRASIAEQFGALPLAVRVAFLPVYVIVERALQLGQWDAALAILSAVAVPAELEPIKSGFIAALTAAKP